MIIVRNGRVIPKVSQEYWWVGRHLSCVVCDETVILTEEDGKITRFPEPPVQGASWLPIPCLNCGEVTDHSVEGRFEYFNRLNGDTD